MTRKTKLMYNTIGSLLYQATNILCGFILPHYFLKYYGSETNGLVASITQFLGFVGLAECGIGAVVQSALYKPLAEKNDEEISKIMISAEKFFHKIAYLLVIYTVILMVIYPLITKSSFNYLYTASLIFIIAFSLFVQYYFSISYSLLLEADSLAFIQLITRALALLANVICSVWLIKIGSSIQIVKAISAMVFLIQPLVLYTYVKKHYNLDKSIILTEEPIKQKWNGLLQHIATVVLFNTDTVILTVFSTLQNVSIYSIYNLIASGVRQILSAFTTGIQPLFGNMYAKKEINDLQKFFSIVEWGIHVMTVLLFTCMGILSVSFVLIYTQGVTDANYNVPLFAYMISSAQAAMCIRLPYVLMVLAAGHYKQTQMSSLIEVILNIGISIVLVMKWGLIGVAIGTLVAMVYRTCYFAYYLSRNILNRELQHFVKHMIVDLITVILIALLTKNLNLVVGNYYLWVQKAILVVLIAVVVSLVVNYIFYKKYIIQFVDKLMHKRNKR